MRAEPVVMFNPDRLCPTDSPVCIIISYPASCEDIIYIALSNITVTLSRENTNDGWTDWSKYEVWCGVVCVYYFTFYESF